MCNQMSKKSIWRSYLCYAATHIIKPLKLLFVTFIGW
uniref:Uncharacterized protein n=1 Tax=Arundo donax TaxID=35708 RepID=A0A0A9E0R7_ARUDO